MEFISIRWVYDKNWIEGKPESAGYDDQVLYKYTLLKYWKQRG
jgi:hypothetical protein